MKSKQLFVNIVTSFLSWGWPVILSVFITPLLLKYIGKNTFGIRALILSVAGYFALFDLGLNGAGTKYLAEFNAKDDRFAIKQLLSTTLTVYLIMGALGALILVLSSSWLCNDFFDIPKAMIPESVIAFKLSGLGFFLGMLTWWITSIPTGLQRFDIFNFVSILYGTLNIGGNLFAAWSGYGIIGIVVSNIISNLIVLVIYYYFAKRLIPYFKVLPAFNLQMFRKTFNYSLYMIGFAVFAIIFSQLDKTLIGIFIGTTAVTFYVIPLSISNINQQVNGKITQVFFPLASELASVNETEKLQQLFLRALNLGIIVGLCVTIPLASFSYPILNLWISPEMAIHSQHILILLVFAFLFGGIIPYNIVAGMGYPKYFTYSAMVSGISSLIFLSILIKPFGITGAALAKLFSMIVTMIYYIHFSNAILKIGYLKILRIFVIPFSTSFILILFSLFYLQDIPSLFVLGLYSAMLVCIFLLAMFLSGQINAKEKDLIFGYYYTFIKRLKSGNKN